MFGTHSKVGSSLTVVSLEVKNGKGLKVSCSRLQICITAEELQDPKGNCAFSWVRPKRLHPRVEGAGVSRASTQQRQKLHHAASGTGRRGVYDPGAKVNLGRSSVYKL